jgi:hypothetical protein
LLLIECKTKNFVFRLIKSVSILDYSLINLTVWCCFLMSVRRCIWYQGFTLSLLFCIAHCHLKTHLRFVSNVTPKPNFLLLKNLSACVLLQIWFSKTLTDSKVLNIIRRYGNIDWPWLAMSSCVYLVVASRHVILIWIF